jgi:phosphoribosylamine---glycine ligase
MKVLLIGSGGREHALAWKLSQSPRLTKLYAAPGNPGTSQFAENVPIKATAIDELLAFALRENIDLTIVGPEDPLALGIVDRFQENGLAIFGPTEAAAQIEASKEFSKQLMKKCGVVTSSYEVHTEYNKALKRVQEHFRDFIAGSPIVIKASGPAVGKGAYVCHDLEEAKEALMQIMVERIHESAGDIVIIEGFVPGDEASMHAFCDGETFHLFPPAQDHKAVFDNNEGPNTGGMGTIAPLSWLTGYQNVGRTIVRPIINSLKNAGTPFVGLLYPGLKVAPDDAPDDRWKDVHVLEFNARFGDPETQVYMRLLKTDILDIFEACVKGELHKINIEWNPSFAACVVMASQGYPSASYKKGCKISGIEKAEKIPGVVVFHAGTKRQNGELVTSGGRVLGVTAMDTTLQGAIDLAYKAVKRIHFEGAHYRTDIGKRSLSLVKQS